MFRLDRISEMREMGDRFDPEPGKTLKDFYRAMEQDSQGNSAG